MADMFIFAVWKGTGRFIPAKAEFAGCLSVDLWLVRGKLSQQNSGKD